MDFGSVKTDIWHQGKDNLYVYTKMLYHSALVFAMVDISPRTLPELMVMTVLIVAGAIITAIIYGLF